MPFAGALLVIGEVPTFVLCVGKSLAESPQVIVGAGHCSVTIAESLRAISAFRVSVACW